MANKHLNPPAAPESPERRHRRHVFFTIWVGVALAFGVGVPIAVTVGGWPVSVQVWAAVIAGASVFLMLSGLGWLALYIWTGNRQQQR